MSISENLMVSQLNSTQKRELLSKVDGKVCGTLMSYRREYLPLLRHRETYKILTIEIFTLEYESKPSSIPIQQTRSYCNITATG